MATRLTGVKCIVNGRSNLKRIYKKTLRILDRIPKQSAYRINTEKILCYRLSVVNSTEDLKEIEETICCGRFEMIFSQALAEYDLAQKMTFWKPWEPLIEKPLPSQWKWPPCQQ